MSRRHKVFVSYHHELDESRKKIFELRFGNSYDVIVPGAVQVGDIDPNLPHETIRQKIRDEYLRDASVTIVLVGARTWQRRHVDWEISSTLRDTALNPRGGLLGVILPGYYDAYYGGRRGRFDPNTIPPRLWDNVQCGFAKLHDWSEDHAQVQDWVHEAYLRKGRLQPDNSRDLFRNNRSGDRWQ